MSIFYIIVSISFFVLIFRNILFWVALWQDKEYRLDRLKVHLQETLQGKGLINSTGNIVNWGLFLVGLVLPFSFFSLYALAIGFVFIYKASKVLMDIKKHRIKKPVFTMKVAILILGCLLIVEFIYIHPLTNIYFWLLCIDLVLPIIISLVVFLLSVPTRLYQLKIIKKATEKMKQNKKILVIAVSGSYGKTSTKEYIAQILAKNFNVIKTPGSNNTPIGIANTILNKITDDTEIFVVEMGAYKIGEIKELCVIVQPNISVTTAASDQHLSLYGSLENVIASEYELIEAMASDGISLFNANSLLTNTLYNKTSHRKYYYGISNKNISGIDIRAKDIILSLDSVSFKVEIGKDKYSFSCGLLGIHTIENILPAIYIAKYLKLSKKEIAYGVSRLVSPAKTMRKINFKNGAIGIDDTYNITPESLFAALNYLGLGKNKKYLVFAPLTELGKHASARHEEIGRKVGEVCDSVFVLNQNFEENILNGIRESGKRCEAFFVRPEVIAEKLQVILKKDDIVVFEGKESAIVMNKIL